EPSSTFLGTYSVTPNIKSSQTYNLNSYEDLYEFAIKMSEETLTEETLAERISQFNEAHDDITLYRYCDDNPFLYEIGEQILDCKNNGEENCQCEITAKNGEGLLLLDDNGIVTLYEEKADEDTRI